MTYSPTIPGPNDLLSQSQADIQTNFNQANLIMGINHVNFDNSLPAGSLPADRGKHTFVTLIEQAANPATALNEIAIYCRDLGGISTQYLRKENNGTVIQISGPDPVAAVAGQTFLPGGIIMKWGTAVVNVAGTAIAFPVAFPAACFSITVTSVSNTSRGHSVNNVNAAGFTAYAENNGTTMYWTAIGN
jgi:hypothetical protein